MPPQPESIFCEACLKHQRLYIASIAQYESENPSDDFSMDKEWYRYRRNLVNRYPQCCEECKPRVEGAIKKADYRALCDAVGRKNEQSRDPRLRASKSRTGMDYISSLGKAAWWGALMLQLGWHLKALVEAGMKSADGMRDPDDDSWTTAGLGMVNEAAGYLPQDEQLIWWSLIASLASGWWNPKFNQVLRGFDRHIVGVRQWYMLQFFLCALRTALLCLSIETQPKNAQLAAHMVAAGMTLFVTSRATRTIRIDNRRLFSTHKEPPPTTDDIPTPSFSLKRKQTKPQPSLAETLTSALPQPDESPRQRKIMSDERPPDYEYQFTPNIASQPEPVAEEDGMDWQPTGSTTLPRALRNDTLGAGNRPFGQAPVHENNRPFYYRAPEAPAHTRTSPKHPVMWGSQGDQRGFAPKPARRSEFAEPRFFAQPRGSDVQEDEQLAGLVGGFSFSEQEKNKGGWFGFGRK